MMKHSQKKTAHGIFFWIVIVCFVLFYPMFISIYVFLPLMVGTSSYILLRGLEENDAVRIVLPIVYLVNLEVNLSLPLFLSTISALVVYVFVFHSLFYFRRCQLCIALLSVFVLDIMYLGMLFVFDFIFQTRSIFLDTILVYSFIVDMLVVILL